MTETNTAEYASRYKKEKHSSINRITIAERVLKKLTNRFHIPPWRHRHRKTRLSFGSLIQTMLPNTNLRDLYYLTNMTAAWRGSTDTAFALQRFLAKQSRKNTSVVLTFQKTFSNVYLQWSLVRNVIYLIQSQFNIFVAGVSDIPTGKRYIALDFFSLGPCSACSDRVTFFLWFTAWVTACTLTAAGWRTWTATHSTALS